MTSLLTEDQIERTVERLFDRLDAKLMSGKLTQAEYDDAAADITAKAREAEMNAIYCRFYHDIKAGR